TPAGRPAPPPAADQFRTAEASLSGYACGKCHYTTTTPAKETRIAPIPNKTVWFAHAKFNHVSHRGVRCADCHPGTESSFRAGGALRAGMGRPPNQPRAPGRPHAPRHTHPHPGRVPFRPEGVGMIVQRLRDIQNRFGYLPDEELKKLAREADVPLYRVEEVA